MNKVKYQEAVNSIDVVDNKILDLQKELELWKGVRRSLIDEATEEGEWTDEELLKQCVV